jgi:hypothetical protein
VPLSLVGIASGLIVMHGFLTNQRLDGWTAMFLTTTALTSLTAFLFPFTGVTPTIKLGIISLAVLAIAIVARYPLHLVWRKTDCGMRGVILQRVRPGSAVPWGTIQRGKVHPPFVG